VEGVVKGGSIITVKGLHGTFRVREATEQEVTCWGPLGTNRSMWRTFHIERVTSITDPTTDKETT
jgi:hypothetical protein